METRSKKSVHRHSSTVAAPKAMNPEPTTVSAKKKTKVQAAEAPSFSPRPGAYEEAYERLLKDAMAIPSAEVVPLHLDADFFVVDHALPRQDRT